MFNVCGGGATLVGAGLVNLGSSTGEDLMKFADFLQDFLHQGKEQARVNNEPDPEEKDEHPETI